MVMLPVTTSTEVVPSGTRVNFLSVVVMLGVTAVGGLGLLLAGSVGSIVGAAVLGLLLGMAPQVAQQWERAVVLRLGRFTGLRGPGLFWRIPFVDSVTAWVDQRVITTPFAGVR